MRIAVVAAVVLLAGCATRPSNRKTTAEPASVPAAPVASKWHHSGDIPLGTSTRSVQDALGQPDHAYQDDRLAIWDYYVKGPNEDYIYWLTFRFANGKVVGGEIQTQ